MYRYFSFDSPQTLYSIYRLTEPDRRRAYTGGVTNLHSWIAPGMFARVEAAGYGLSPREHHVVRVTRGTVDVDAQWRRARHATRARMENLFVEDAQWNAVRLERCAQEEAAQRAEDERHREQAEREAIGAELADLVL